MSSLSGVPRPAGRCWFNPATWHLRTRLILLSMALLVAICGAVGVVSYASMDVFLTKQLDEQLAQAASRRPARRRAIPAGRPDPLDARGQAVGTLNAQDGRRAAHPGSGLPVLRFHPGPAGFRPT